MLVPFFRRFVRTNYLRAFSSILGFVYIILLIFLAQICANIVAIQKVNQLVATTINIEPELTVSTVGAPYLWQSETSTWISLYDAHLSQQEIEYAKDCVIATVLLSSSNTTLSLVYLYFIPERIFSLYNVSFSNNSVLVSPHLANVLELKGSNYTFYPVELKDDEYTVNVGRNISLLLKVSYSFDQIMEYLVSFNRKISEKNSLLLPLESLTSVYSYFQGYLYQMSYLAFLKDKPATIFKRISIFIEEKRQKTQQILNIFEKLLRITARTKVYTPVLDNLDTFVNGEYKNWLRMIFSLLIPVFLGLILYQLQDLELLKISCWYNDIVIHKMRGASYFQQFFGILLLYATVDFAVFSIMSIGLFILSIIFRNLLSWLGIYFILSSIALLLSLSIQALGIFRTISEVYKSNLIISEEHNSLITTTFKEFEIWKGTKNKRTFIVFFLLLLTMETGTEIGAYYLLTLGVDPSSVFEVIFFPRFAYFVFLLVILFAYIWKNLVYQVVNFAERIVRRSINESVLFKKYLLRTMKRSKFFIFFMLLILISLFGFLSFGDTVSNLYNTKQEFMYPYDVMIRFPSNVENNKSLIYGVPGIDKLTRIYLTTPSLYYGSNVPTLFIVDGKNFTKYLPKFSFSYVTSGDRDTLSRFASDTNSCIISTYLSFTVGSNFSFGFLQQNKIVYNDLKVIGKAKFLPGMMGLLDAKYYKEKCYWALINYKRLMNETIFSHKANIFFISLKKDTDINSFIDLLITKAGISAKWITVQPPLEVYIEPLFGGNFYEELNLQMNTALMTVFLDVSYITFLITGILMIMNANITKIKLSIELLHLRGIGKRRAEKAYLMLSWYFFIILEILGFAVGITMGFIASTIAEIVEFPFFKPYLSLNTLIAFVLIVVISMFVSLMFLKKDFLIEKFEKIKEIVSKIANIRGKKNDKALE